MHADHLSPSSNHAQSAEVAPETLSTSHLMEVAPSPEEIAVEAEVPWRQEGCPKDRDEAIWLEAERQLFQVARTFRNVQDEKALLNPISRLDLKSDDVMGELSELFLAPDDIKPPSP